MVYVTHDQEGALAVSDRIVVMQQGRVGAIGSPRDLYESPQTRFIGDANLIEGELTTVAGAHWFRAGTLEMAVASSSGTADSPVALEIRPHRIRLGLVEGSVIIGTSLRQVYLGSRIESIVTTPAGELLVFTDPLLRYWRRVRRWVCISTNRMRGLRRGADHD